MNVAVHPCAFSAAEPVPEPRRSQRLRLGMPQLNLNGLSETWLLKEAGDVHWRLIADLAGRDRPDFRDETGEPVYAAFCAVSSEGLALDRFREHDELVIASTIRQVSRTRFASRHTLMRGSEPAGTVDLLSVFVRRQRAGGNRTIAKVCLPEFVAPPGEGVVTPIAALSDRLRKSGWQDHRGFKRTEFSSHAPVRFRPCPAQDFNGAGLLYFAAYQEFADRAEWELLDLPVEGVSTVSRDIVFRGNIEPGETILVTIRGMRRTTGLAEHWMTMEAEGDGRNLADVFTTKSCALAET